MTQTYTSKSAARRAAKAACKKIFGKAYEAFEGVDFEIHEDGYFFNRTFRFALKVAA